MRGLICGPKVAACGMVLGTWGVIMLVMLGIFFITHSAILIDDVPLTVDDFPKDGGPPVKIYEKYNIIAYNCFIAAGVYVVLGLFSCCQMKLNQRMEYLVR